MLRAWPSVFGMIMMSCVPTGAKTGSGLPKWTQNNGMAYTQAGKKPSRVHLTGSIQRLKPHMHRKEIFAALKENPEISVLIVGAGINGIGTFRDLALNGVDVLLVDRCDFCSGASSASSHMAHGGIRYLENGEFRLVREAVQERNRMIKNAAHIVKPLPTTVPIFRYFSGILNAPFKFLGIMDKPSERGSLIIKLRLMMYDAYTG